MHVVIRLASLGAVLASVALLSPGFARAQDSGFLADYSMLKDAKDASGDKVKRYVSPKFKPGAYQAVIIDPTQYYPAPEPTEQVSAHTLIDISNYVDRGIHDALAAKMTVVSQPGPGVLRIRPAITAVAGKKTARKAYQYIPIAFVISAATRGDSANLGVEVAVEDSVTGERLAALVRSGVGAQLSGKDAKLSLTDVQPLLDKWIGTGSAFVAEQMK